MQEYKIYIDSFEETYGKENDISKRADEEYRLSNRKGKQEYANEKPAHFSRTQEVAFLHE